MTHAFLLFGVYAWLGFTAGYYFRKWLDTSLVPRFAAERIGPAAPPTHTAHPVPDPGDESVDWVDEEDRVLGVVPRREMRRRNLLHRVTATFVFRADGRLFVQQRAATKDVYPSLFDPCVGGTVASGEGYLDNATREVAEELGLAGMRPVSLFEHRYQDAYTNSRIRVFACVGEGPVRLQESEVAGGSWEDEAEIQRLASAGRLCPDSAVTWKLYLDRFGSGHNFARDILPGLKPSEGRDA
jgi:isopentenyldiphosphate isomerase